MYLGGPIKRAERRVVPLARRGELDARTARHRGSGKAGLVVSLVVQ